MKSHLLLPLLAGALVPLSAYSQTQGVPFQQLQRQIDQLRERIHSLETTRPNGQLCPEGQFVTGFSTTGAIVCAAPGSVTPPPPPPPPPPPAPIPESWKAAFQQALNGAAGVDVPLDFPQQTQQVPGVGAVTYDFLRYSLAVGTAQIVQPSPTTVTVQIPVPSASVVIAASLDSPFFPTPVSADVTVTTSGVVSVQLTVVMTTTGASRLGSVSAVTLVPVAVNVDGLGAFGLLADFVEPSIKDQVLTAFEAQLTEFLNDMLPLLPDF